MENLDLFGNSVKTETKLKVVPNAKKILTKLQKKFNKLVKQVEALRNELEGTGELLDNHLRYYGTEIRPLELVFIETRRRHLLLIVPCIKEMKGLTKKERSSLQEYAINQLDEILTLMDGEPDEELKAMYLQLNGITFDEASEDEFYSMKADLEDMFDDMGIDLNLDGLHKDMSEEEIAEKVAELQTEFERLDGEMEKQQAAKKKTKKQQERELREQAVAEMKKKSLSSIYKQLAKILHPDLESDPILKMQKEEVMKQLTTAYNNNDLHTLLRLEIEWIGKQEENISQLADDKLSVYNDVLKQQIVGMEMERSMLYQNPRYMPLFRFSNIDELTRSKTLEHKKKQITELVDSLQEVLNTDLKKPNPVGYIKELAHFNQRLHQKNHNFDIFESTGVSIEDIMRVFNRK
ncbi:MAG: hypothetical protein H7259_08795 [Cytophagales bacterium]|nr:hypothetical protein [Cytophaga sp.]